MPMGATLALRSGDKGFTRKIDGAKLRSSVPHGHFTPLPGHFGWFNRLLYREERRLSCPERGGNILATPRLGHGHQGKGFFPCGIPPRITPNASCGGGNTPPPHVWRPRTRLKRHKRQGVIKHRNGVYPKNIAVHLAGRRRVAAPAGGNLFEMGALYQS
jgi:hypothetical protein